jgi:GT2 family glycosyltransferase
MSISAAPRVTVQILNWNGKVDTLQCLESLERLTYKCNEIVVVDNASTDDSVHAISARFPEITILQSGGNLGFAGGNNVGLRHLLGSTSDFVLLLNNDTQVAPDLLERLLDVVTAHGDRTTVGAITLSLERPEAVQFGGAAWEPATFHFRWLHGNLDDPAYTPEMIESDYIQGSAMLIPVAALREVGLFDERYFLVYEDTDWCYRARAHGYRCCISTRARIWHKESPSFGGKNALYVYFATRNRLLWARAHFGRRGLIAVIKRLYWTTLGDFRDHRAAFASQEKNRPLRMMASFMREPRQVAIRAGILDYVLGRFGNCPDKIRRLNSRDTQIKSRRSIA